MKLLTIKKASKSNQRLWMLTLAGIQLSFATFGSFAQSLPNLMNSALLSHPSIASQRAQMQAAEIGIETAEWQYFPRESNCDDGLSNSYLISKDDYYYIDVSSFSEYQLGKYCFNYSVLTNNAMG